MTLIRSNLAPLFRLSDCDLTRSNLALLDSATWIRSNYGVTDFDFLNSVFGVPNLGYSPTQLLDNLVTLMHTFVMSHNFTLWRRTTLLSCQGTIFCDVAQWLSSFDVDLTGNNLQIRLALGINSRLAQDVDMTDSTVLRRFLTNFTVPIWLLVGATWYSVDLITGSCHSVHNLQWVFESCFPYNIQFNRLQQSLRMQRKVFCKIKNTAPVFDSQQILVSREFGGPTKLQRWP